MISSEREVLRSDVMVIDLHDAEVWRDLNGTLAKARADGPVARTADGTLVFLRYADVNEGLRHHAMSTAALDALLLGNGVTDGPLWDWCHRIMLSMDPPAHTRLRSSVSKAFSARRLQAVRGPVRAKARALLDAHRAEGRMDWVSDFAHELPIWVICELIGVPVEDRHLFKEWTIELSLVFSNVLTDDDRVVAENALEALFGYVRDLIAERRRRPADDLLSALINPSDGADRLSDIELEAMVANLLNGGHETTRTFLSIAVPVLLAHPDQLALLRDRPDLMPGAVEELLRYESPIVSTMRIAREDLTLGGIPVGGGEMVILSFLAANRDPEQFREPERFDIRRPDVRPVSFGFGIHHCVGAALARLEGEEALTELVTTCGELELECEPEWLPFFQVRRIKSLPLRFAPV